MSVLVAAGQVWVPGTLSSTTGFPTNQNAQTAYQLPASFNQQASYFQWYNATTNLVVPAADPTNPRLDIVVVSVQDAAYSGSNNQGILQYITGTPNPSPVAPNAPASSVVLAQVSVAANQTSVVTANITDKRPSLSVRNGIRPYCRVWRNGAFSWPTSSGTFIFDSVTVDNLSGYSTGTGKYTVPEAGQYLVSVGLGVTPTDTDFYYAQVAKNGVVTTFGGGSLGGTQNSVVPVTDLVQCAVGDTLNANYYGQVTSTGVVGSTTTYMSIMKVSN